MARESKKTLACLLLAVITLGFPAILLAADPTESGTDTSSQTPSAGAAMLLEDVAEPLVPKKARTERDEDHLQALAHFSAGRACQRRKENAPAIRHYQRALQWDPTASNAVWPIVALAEQLQWRDVRNRYLLRAAKLDPDAFDPADLIELVELVSSKEELRLVTRLFEKAIAERKDEKKTALDIILRWRLAEIYVASNDHGKAADYAASVLESLENPQSFGVTRDKLEKWFGQPHPPYWLFGEYFLLADRLVEAETTFKKAHQTEPDAGRLHYHLARISLKRKQPDVAQKHLEACFREKFSNEGAEPYRLLRQSLVEQGKENELIARLEKLMASHPNDASLACFTAEQYLKADQLDKAATLYGLLLEKQPTPLVHAGLIEIHREKDRVEPLLYVLGKAAARDASLDSLEGPIKRLTADTALVDKLFATARKRLAEKPTSFGAHAPLAMAQLAIEARRPDQAQWFFELAIQTAPEDASDVLLLWGGHLMAAEDHAKAADIFRRGAEKKLGDGDKSIFYYYLASSLELAGRTDEALAAAREACRLNPDSPLLASHEGWILYHARRNDQARAAYDPFIKRFDADHSSMGTRHVVREARLLLSHLEVQRKNYQQAAERLEEVLDEFPNDVSALNDLGYLWADQGLHLQRALRMVRRAADTEPDNPAYRDSLGWALYRLGRLQEAVVILEKTAGELPEGEVLDHLGEVYFKLGKTRQAADTWRRAVEAHRAAHQTNEAKAVEAKLLNTMKK